MTPTVAIITSLYRSDRLLPAYCTRLRALAAQTARAGFPLEAVIVANDATRRERAALDALARQAEGEALRLRILHVARESLYASWNRAIAAADAAVLTPWNVDDRREAAAIVEGARLFAADPGVMLVDFPICIEAQWRYFGVFTVRRDRMQPAYPHAQRGGHPADRWRANAFFMFRRDLIAHAGDFDTRFRIVGDVEWQTRAARAVDAESAFRAGDATGGTFVIGGGNLSGGSNRARLNAEENIFSLLYDETPRARLTDPDVMRATLAHFPELTPPPDWLARLTDEAARRAWTREQRLSVWRQRRAALRAPFSLLVDRLGLRRDPAVNKEDL